MKESSGISGSINLEELFPFSLDDFQLQAIAALEAGKSVVVCAPTGSGKTLIGEYAIHRALSRGKRVFYTTPLKALSNQKFRDFQELLGDNRQVGLITGDIIINANAPVVIMTTEIFRNMLYETPIGEVGTSLENLESVVLDECHYISDSQRGTVWEESIVYCSAQIQLVALSATIGNPEQLTDWINQVRASQQSSPSYTCELINSNHRPVPLKYYFSNVNGLFPLLNQKQNKLNPQLKDKKRGNRFKRVKKEDCPTVPQIIAQLQQAKMLPAIYIIFSRKGCEQAIQKLVGFQLVTPSESRQIYIILLKFFLAESSELQLQLWDFLAPNQQLQQKLINLLADNSEAERELWEYIQANPEANAQIFAFLAEKSGAARLEQLEPLLRGIASHHAGLLPPWKELIEKLFELGLIKVVFATATLAAGINMPARTTVISALSKRTESGHSMLSPSEFLQIAGRAGRRGKDKVGYVVTIQTPYEGAQDAAKLATADPEPLRSWFTPSYGMVLNLLQKHTLVEVKNLLERSFAEYLAQLKLAPSRQKITELTTTLAKLDVELAEIERAGIDSDAIKAYQKLKEHLKEEDRLLDILRQQAQIERKKAIAPKLLNLEAGNIVALKGKNIPVASPLNALLVIKIPGPGQAPELVCLGADNYWYLATHADIMDINPGKIDVVTLSELSLPDLEKIKPGRCQKGDRLSEVVVAQMLRTIVPETVPEEIQTQQARVDAVEAQLESHPLSQRKNAVQILKHYQQRPLIREQLSQIQEKYRKNKTNSSYYWRDFLILVEILQEFQALNGLEITPLGEVAALIRGENELWLSLALISGAFEHLEPAQLAAAVSALITEPPRPDAWVECVPTASILQALGLIKPYQELEHGMNLRELRRQLNQVQKRYEGKLSRTPPVLLESKMLGLVEQWALGLEWQELCEMTSLDEGDIVRLLRRTIDVLWQIPQIKILPTHLRSNASQAIALLKRFPI